MLAAGPTTTAKGPTTVSAAERAGRQLVPLAMVMMGLGILLYRFCWNSSALHAPTIALVICGGIAAGVQLLTAILVSSYRRRMVTIFADVMVIIATLAVVGLGEYVVCDLFNIQTVTYAHYPGTQINTVGTFVAGSVVILLGFCPSARDTSGRVEQKAVM